MGLTIVLALRLLVPLTIPRWPLAGTVLAIAADTVDILIYNAFGFPQIASYHEIDKLLDLYYMSIMVLVVQGWAPMPGTIATALFAYRLVGTALYEVTDLRTLLLFFPNLFEMFYLFHLLVIRHARAYTLGASAAAGWLFVLLIPKLGQEYALHQARVLDDLVAKDVIADVAGWIANIVAR